VQVNNSKTPTCKKQGNILWSFLFCSLFCCLVCSMWAPSQRLLQFQFLLFRLVTEGPQIQRQESLERQQCALKQLKAKSQASCNSIRSSEYWCPEESTWIFIQIFSCAGSTTSILD
jgi:hypothetical protein